jgi:hypothetical protein
MGNALLVGYVMDCRDLERAAEDASKPMKEAVEAFTKDHPLPTWAKAPETKRRAA